MKDGREAQDKFFNHVASNYIAVDPAGFEGGMRVLNIDPPILTVRSFLTPEQCDALKRGAESSGRMERSAVGGHSVEGRTEIRTSSTLAATSEVNRHRTQTFNHARKNELTDVRALLLCPHPNQVLKATPQLDTALEDLLARARQLLPASPPRGPGMFSKPSGPDKISFELPQVAHYTQGECKQIHGRGARQLF